jgi:hypothetical protein
MLFDAETIAVIKMAFDDACSHLSPKDRNVPRSVLAERVLKAAATGERDPVRLRAWALADFRGEAQADAT